MNSGERRTAVMDMDGTICTQTYNNTYRLAEPNLDVIKKINKLWSDGWNIVIHTARGMRTFSGDINLIELNYRKLTEEWLVENRVCYTKLVFGKPPGDIYVDDKGISINEFTNGDI